MPNYFHLSSIMLRPGSIIEPGNWGRIIRATGPQHPYWAREQALESARLKKYRDKPSRFEAAFASVDEAEARSFRARIPGFTHHVLYQISLVSPEAPSHLMDTRLCDHQGSQNYDWADLYWHDYDPDKIVIPGMGTVSAATNNVPCRELVTISALKIEQVL